MRLNTHAHAREYADAMHTRCTRNDHAKNRQIHPRKYTRSCACLQPSLVEGAGEGGVNPEMACHGHCAPSQKVQYYVK